MAEKTSVVIEVDDVWTEKDDTVGLYVNEERYYFPRKCVSLSTADVEEGKTESLAAQRVPYLDVTHMDHSMGHYPLPRGYRIDSASRTLAIRGGKGKPPTRIPLDNVRSWTTRNP